MKTTLSIRIGKELLSYGEAKGWLTDEDVFRDIS